MNRHMVGEAGSRFFEMASSLGRIHADTLTGLADAAAKTPLGPVFAMNATLARMANDGIETLASRMNVESAAIVDTTVMPAAKAVAAKSAAPKAEAKPSATPRPKPKKAKAPAPFSVETAPTALATADLVEPDAADVLIDDVMLDDVLADASATTASAKDDLTVINGIGATTQKKLNGVGIESFAQIAGMTEKQFADVLESLDIKSIRFSPALWIEAAKAQSA